jgi:hypothetical protein
LLEKALVEKVGGSSGNACDVALGRTERASAGLAASGKSGAEPKANDPLETLAALKRLFGK